MIFSIYFLNIVLNVKQIKMAENRRRKYLIGETHTTTKQDSTNDEHFDVLGGGVEGGAEYEENTGDQHGGAAAKAASGVGGEEGGS